MPYFAVFVTTAKSNSLKEWRIWLIHFLGSMTPEKLVKFYGTPFSACCVNSQLEHLSRQAFCSHLGQYLAAVPCFPNTTCSFHLLKPKWKDKNHHMALCRASGLETPDWPLLRSLSSSFRLAARTLMTSQILCAQEYRMEISHRKGTSEFFAGNLIACQARIGCH